MMEITVVSLLSPQSERSFRASPFQRILYAKGFFIVEVQVRYIAELTAAQLSCLCNMNSLVRPKYTIEFVDNSWRTGKNKAGRWVPIAILVQEQYCGKLYVYLCIVKKTTSMKSLVEVGQTKCA